MTKPAGGMRPPAASSVLPCRIDGVVWGVGFSQDGGRFLTVAARPGDRTALGRGECPSVWSALPHRISVTVAVAFHPRGRLVATGGWGETCGSGTSPAPVRSVPLWPNPAASSRWHSIPPAGCLQAAGEAGTCRVWTVPEPVGGTPDRVREWVQSITGAELNGDEPVRPHGRPQHRPRRDQRGGRPDPPCQEKIETERLGFPGDPSNRRRKLVRPEVSMARPWVPH